jgi:proteasome assembly chaperone (PAC2) family protein
LLHGLTGVGHRGDLAASCRIEGIEGLAIPRVDKLAIDEQLHWLLQKCPHCRREQIYCWRHIHQLSP